MTEEELKQEVHDLKERVENLEAEKNKLANLPEAVAELKGMVSTLSSLVTLGFDKTDRGLERAAGVKTAITFASVVVVPVIVAVITGYFALKAAVGK